MTAKEYVINFINNLLVNHPFLSCTYGYDSLDYTHSIEIIPLGFNHKIPDFNLIEDQFYDEFFSLFPNEIVYILTTQSCFPISNPIYKKVGTQFNLWNEFELSKNNIDNVSMFHSFNIFSNTLPNFVRPSVNDSFYSFDGSTFNDYAVLIETIIVPENLGQDNYALAA
jgi:hypothetical protein